MNINVKTSQEIKQFVSPMYGAVSDVYVWDKMLTDEDEDNWMNCNSENEGTIFSWQQESHKITMKGLKKFSKIKSSVCPKLFDDILISHDTRTFYDAINFCNKVGDMAATKNIETAHEVMKAFNTSSCNPQLVEEPKTCFYVYTGFTDVDIEGDWIHYESNEKMSWNNWADGEPGFNEHCGILDIRVMNLRAVNCINIHIASQACNMAEVNMLTLKYYCNDMSFFSEI